MTGKPQHDYPPDEELVPLVEAHGVSGAARSLGLKPATLRGRLESRGLPTRKKPDATARRAIDDPMRVDNDRLRDELKELRAENREYAKERASRQALFEQIIEEARHPVKAPKLPKKKQRSGLPVRHAVAPIFDVQYGQHVLPEDTPHGRGIYSTAIFDKRAVRYYEAVTGCLRDYSRSHRIAELVIPLGGDLVEGHGIFPGQEWQLEIDPAVQVHQLACKLGGNAEGDTGVLQELIRFARAELGIPRVRIYGVPGNHGKVGGRKAGALHSTHSWDWLTLMMLQDKLRAEPVSEFVIEPAGALYFGVADFVFLTIHGDEIRGWGGLPFYGLSRYDGKAIRQGHVIHDYLLLGDKHIPAEIEQGGGGETLMSGAWVGDNNLSRQLGAGARPRQSVYLVAKKWGITASERIYFEEAEIARAPARVHGAKAA